MVIYLAYVRPFRKSLTVKVLGGNSSDYWWMDEHNSWNTDPLIRALKRETGKRLGVQLNMLDHRHTFVGVGRERVGQLFGKGYQGEVGEAEEPEVDEGTEDLIALQKAWTTLMDVGNYGVPIDIVKHPSARSIEAFHTLSGAWHWFLGLNESGTEQQDTQAADTDARRDRNRRERSRDDEH